MRGGLEGVEGKEGGEGDRGGACTLSPFWSHAGTGAGKGLGLGLGGDAGTPAEEGVGDVEEGEESIEGGGRWGGGAEDMEG